MNKKYFTLAVAALADSANSLQTEGSRQSRKMEKWKFPFILYFFYIDGFPEGPGEEVSAPAVEAEQTPT